MSTPSPGQEQTTSALPTVTLTAALALLSFVMPLATDMYLPAFPRMADELNTDASGVQFTLTSFLIGTAAGQLVLGPLSDRYGRRTPILVGAAVCTVATALCAVAPNLSVLIVLRFVTGFSGAAGLVVGRAVVADVASGAAAARLFGVLMALGGIAPIAAPLAGGAVVNDAGGWRGVFWVLAGVSLLTFLAALAFIPESLPKERRRADGMAATSQAARSVLTDRAYVGYTLAFAFGCGALFCYIAGSPFLLQNVLGFSVGEASIAFSVGALTATVSSTVSTKLVGTYAPRPPAARRPDRPAGRDHCRPAGHPGRTARPRPGALAHRHRLPRPRPGLRHGDRPRHRAGPPRRRNRLRRSRHPAGRPRRRARPAGGPGRQGHRHAAVHRHGRLLPRRGPVAAADAQQPSGGGTLRRSGRRCPGEHRERGDLTHFPPPDQVGRPRPADPAAGSIGRELRHRAEAFLRDN
ncbi:multidrug effflux MFS transporter [Streptomyces sp. LB8]|uniref:multidrug effflux MFS transporter n=1 Tax=Streptomyces sp. LB8 TaxID=3042509 RepID=UPI0026494625|nr:multidrug effflux MFS transporter [Streptomyces sp. LB8]MDN5381905.1 multidrug effflux MFS transporter [Streptomyces sp. LB8]